MSVNEAIKLKLKTNQVTKDSYIESKFIQACENLDASIFEPLIEEEQYFDDLDKYRFLQQLKDIFDNVKSKDITKTKAVLGECGLCYPGHETLNFISKEKEFAYLVHKEDGNIIDIMRCNMSGIENYRSIIKK